MDNIEIKKAEQQFLGFVHAKRGYDIISLVEAMALTEDEWYEIETDSIGLSNDEIREIDNYFK